MKIWIMEVYSDLYIARKAQTSQKHLLAVESHRFQKLMELETHLR